jgi:hypothetical protein
MVLEAGKSNSIVPASGGGLLLHGSLVEGDRARELV